MKIQLKRSNVLENGKAKQPTSAQMAYGELAVNYNTADPTIFIKDSANGIVAITSFDDAGLQQQISDLDAKIDSEIAALPTPDPLEGTAYQPGTLDDRYVSRFSWSDLPDFSTAP